MNNAGIATPEDVEAETRKSDGAPIASRPGWSEDAAQAVVFLACEPRSSYVTGSELYVDGGRTAQ